MSAALWVAARRCRGQLVGAGREPRFGELARHLDVTLEADVPSADDERLVGVERIGEHGHRARGQRERVVVPLKRR